MRTRVQKWGNSLALRIPRSFALEVGLEKETQVDIAVEDGRLVVARSAEGPWTLSRLLAGITPENLHAEIDSGPSAGREEW